MNAIRLLAENPETVTISRADLGRIDGMPRRTRKTSPRFEPGRPMSPRLGMMRRSRNSYTGAETKRLLNGESPVWIWHEKRGMTQRALAAAAAIQAGYRSEIESRRKPGSVAAYRALATALAVPMAAPWRRRLMREAVIRLHLEANSVMFLSHSSKDKAFPLKASPICFAPAVMS